MDIDIDFPSTFDPLEFFNQGVRASMIQDGVLKKHPAGIYFQSIPTDKITNLSAIPYEQAEKIGYTKIDFLHLTLLDHFNNKNEIKKLMEKEPDWFLLRSASNVKKLFQIHNHFEIINKVKPESVEELADCIALIRPAKRHLLEEYISTIDKDNIRKKIYSKPKGNKYYFKKSHAIAYALTIVLQLHLIKSGIL